MIGSWLSKLSASSSSTLDTSSPSSVSSSFDAASTSRRLQRWGLSLPGPNTALYFSLENLRKRSRRLHNDNPWAGNGIESHVSNLIGRGITPRWRTGDPGLNRELKQLWDESVNEMDADGVLDFYGLQALAATSFVESGEVLGQFQYLPRNANILVPLKLRLMEPDYLDTTIDTVLPNGGYRKMGIEFNSRGERTAYHLYRSHPGETLLYDTLSIDTLRIPADRMLHIFKPLRPGQIRGLPWLTTIITRLYQLDEYEDSELKRKAVAAMFAGFITSPAGTPDVADLPGEETTYNSETVVTLEPGTLQSLQNGEDIKFSSPVDVGQTYEVWIKQQLRAVAAGMGVTYEQLTGDLSGVNYTSIRAGLIEFRRRCRMTQRNIITFQLCRPFATRWLDAAVLNNTITIRDYWTPTNHRKYTHTVWDPDGWDFTDPLKDLKGKQLALRLGIQSRAQVVGEQGNDVEYLDDEIAEDNSRADSKGLIFDSDPRKVNTAGSLHEKKGGTNSNE